MEDRPARRTRSTAAARRGTRMQPEPEARVMAVQASRGHRYQGHEAETQRAEFHWTEPPLLGSQGHGAALVRSIGGRRNPFRFGGPGSHPDPGARLFLCRHDGIMRCWSWGSNGARPNWAGGRRNWEELARPAKHAGLAKEEKDVWLCGHERPRAIRRFHRIARRGELCGRDSRQNPAGGGGKPAGGGVGQHWPGGGDMLLPEELPQHRRQPQPDAGSSVESAIAASRIRRIMGSLRLAATVMTSHLCEFLASRGGLPCKGWSRECRLLAVRTGGAIRPLDVQLYGHLVLSQCAT
jgi:hypothetical protein